MPASEQVRASAIRTLALSVAAALVLSACALIEPSRPTTLADVDRLTQEDRYGRALAELERLAAEQPDVETVLVKRHEVLYLAHQFERAEIEKARSLQAQGDWNAAIARLDAAIELFPSSTLLHSTRTELTSQQEKRAQELDTDLMLARAGWLLEQRKVLAGKRAVDAASWQEKWQGPQVEEELARLHAPLTELGLQALERGELDLAERSLGLAARIEPATEIEQGLARLAKQRAGLARESKAQRRRQQAEQARARQQSLLVQARTYIDAGDLAAARDALEAALRLGPDYPPLGEIRQQLDHDIAAKVEVLIAEGNSLYRRGLFPEARDLWREAVVLDPENTLARARLERAERVMQKLEQLRQQQLPAQP